MCVYLSRPVGRLVIGFLYFASLSVCTDTLIFDELRLSNLENMRE